MTKEKFIKLFDISEDELSSFIVSNSLEYDFCREFSSLEVPVCSKFTINGRNFLIYWGLKNDIVVILQPKEI